MFVHGTAECRLPEADVDVGKSQDEAETLLLEAEDLLDNQDWSAAASLLNLCVRIAPSPSYTLSSSLYYRAVALLGMGEPSLGLRDATLAGIKGSWPEERLYKLYRLQARCQVGLGEVIESKKCLHRALSALDK